ncbi:MAG TPA: serine hydrolase [Puia sp.]|jgi:CubicO group peptidase (beta-lactamase class C family)|nr:serine hydrolase [Puia sp.]
MKPLLTLLCCGLLLHLSLPAQKRHLPATAGLDASLDTAFARVLKDWHAAGFAVAIVEKNKVIYAKGFGYRDWDGKLPVTPHTLFAIGSCTKAFTASLIGILQQEGRLDIDKPVRDYLPELKFYNPAMDETITLRDMMCHRTGLPRHDLSWYLFGNVNRDSMVRKIQYMEPTAGIREKWQYNNFMFAAQGVVVEKLTGKSWESNITEKIFQPLGMNESYFSTKDMVSSHDAALGYGVKKDSLIDKLDYYEIAALAPAGAINSNVLDMASWVTTWINGGKFNGKEILPASYVSDATSAQMVSAGGTPSKDAPDVFFSSYGFGWFLTSYRGHYRVEHGGNIDGFSASTSLFPSDSIGIIVLSNQNGSQVPSIIRNILADRLLHLPYKDWDTYLKNIADKAKSDARHADSSKISDRKPGTSPSHAAADYTGIYNNPGYGSFEISLKQDSLFALFPLKTWWLKHHHYDVFDPFEKDPKDGIDTSGADGGLRLQFGMDQAGAITSVSMNLEGTLGKPIVFTRTPKATALTAAELQKYAGEYLFGGTVTSKVYIKNGQTLFLFVPGQPEYELVPVGADKFSFKTLTGFAIQFVVDDKGEVTGLLAIQPNGTFKASRKP